MKIGTFPHKDKFLLATGIGMVGDSALTEGSLPPDRMMFTSCWSEEHGWVFQAELGMQFESADDAEAYLAANCAVLESEYTD